MQTDRKADILAAFEKLVSRFGLDKTTMQDIAKELGISVGVIYKDFTNKEELIDAYFNSSHQRFLQICLERSDVEVPAEQALHDFITRVFRGFTEIAVTNRGLWQFFVGEESLKYFRKNAQKHAEFNKMVVSVTSDILARGVREGIFEIHDLTKTAELFLKAFQGYMKELMVDCSDPETVLANVEDMYMFVLRAIKK